MSEKRYRIDQNKNSVRIKLKEIWKIQNKVKIESELSENRYRIKSESKQNKSRIKEVLKELN